MRERTLNFIPEATQVALSGVTARTASALDTGHYRIVSTAACFIRQGSSTVAATVAAGHYIPANTVEHFRVTGDNSNYMAGITTGGVGTLIITQQNES